MVYSVKLQFFLSEGVMAYTENFFLKLTSEVSAMIQAGYHPLVAIATVVGDRCERMSVADQFKIIKDLRKLQGLPTETVLDRQSHKRNISKPTNPFAGKSVEELKEMLANADF